MHTYDLKYVYVHLGQLKFKEVYIQDRKKDIVENTTEELDISCFISSLLSALEMNNARLSRN